METRTLNFHGWFSEICPMQPGIAVSIEVDTRLFSHKSAFQQIDIYQTLYHGRMLVLDGIIQLTEYDEFAYHEMMAHLPLFAHPSPERVLVIGGGDGGVLREAARHTGITKLDICEIDRDVMDAAQTFLPSTACGFDDPRVRVVNMDGQQFLADNPDTYDVIIVDSSDPIGPGKNLFDAPFYETIRTGLRGNGIVAAQGESLFLHPDTVKKLAHITQSLFSRQAYANIVMPTYPGGSIGVCMGSKGPEIIRPARQVPDEMAGQLRYYSTSVHTAAFILPRFIEQMLERP